MIDKDDIIKAMKQAKSMQRDLIKVQKNLSKEEIIVNYNKNKIVIKLNGIYEIISISLDSNIIDRQNIDVLESLLISAFNEGINKVRKIQKKKMSQITGGLDIPKIKFNK